VYACDSGHTFEVFQPITAESLRVCSICGRPASRVIQPVGIVFRGSGFYRNDSRAAAGIKPDGADGDGAKKVEGPTSDKSAGEAKPAASSPVPASTSSPGTTSPAKAAGDQKAG
jgi:predicted nucleic acid-binding Zn ribbon protein